MSMGNVHLQVDGIRLVPALAPWGKKCFRANIRGKHFHFIESESGLSTTWEGFQMDTMGPTKDGIYEPADTLEHCVRNTIATVERCSMDRLRPDTG